VTELLEGETLREKMKRGQIAFRKAIDYISYLTVVAQTGCPLAAGWAHLVPNHTTQSGWKWLTRTSGP
jgi:hypothetical protein